MNNKQLIPINKLRQYRKEISDGRTEFNHNNVMPLVKELLWLRAIFEDSKNNVYCMAERFGLFDERETDE